MRRWKSTIASILTCLAGLIVAPSCHATSSLLFEHLPADFNFQQGFVFCIYQSADGLVWFGKSNGLYSYDGVSLRAYPIVFTDDTATHEISTIAEDSQGHLWLGSTEGIIIEFDRQRQQFSNLMPLLPKELQHSSFNQSAIATDSEIWFSTREGILAINTSTRAMHTIDLPEHEAPAALFKQRDNIIIGGTNGHLYRYQISNAAITGVAHLASSAVINRITVDLHDNIWFSVSDAGVFRVEKNQPIKVWPRFDDSQPAGLRRGFEMDKAGGLWLTTRNHPLLRIDTNNFSVREFQHIDGDSYSIASDQVGLLYLGHDQQLWAFEVGAGLDRASTLPSAFVLHQDLSDLNANNVAVLEGDGSNGVWEAGVGHLLKYFDSNTNSYQNFSAMLSAILPPTANPGRERVIGLKRDSKGMMWIATLHGLLCFDIANKTARRIPWPDYVNLLWAGDIRLQIDADDTLWAISFRGGGLVHYTPLSNEWQHYLPEAGNADSPGELTMTAIVHDHQRLWLATQHNGLDYRDPSGHFHHVHSQPGNNNSLPSDRLHTLSLDGHWLWIGGAAGLAAIDLTGPLDQVHRYPISIGGQSPAIYTIAVDAHGQLWLGSSHGLLKFDPFTSLLKRFSVADGVPTTGYNNSAQLRTGDGHIWLGTYTGLLGIDPDFHYSVDTAAPFLLRHYTLGEQEFPVETTLWPAQLELDYQQHYMSFQVASLNYAAHDQIQYRYRLMGYDNAWRMASRDGHFSFSQFSSGHYELQVEASDVQGKFHDESRRISVYVSPAPWLSVWAYLLYLIAASLALGLWIRRKQRSKRERENYLRQIEQSEERLRLALWGSGDALWDWHLQAGTVFRTGLDFLGYAQADLPMNAQALRKLIHPDDIVNFDREIAKVLDSEESQLRYEFRLRNAEGEWIWVVDRGRVVERDNAGLAIRLSGTLRDINERVLAVQEIHQLNQALESRVIERTLALEQSNRELQQANRDLEGFSYSVSHDLRAPLRAINGFGQVLQADYSEQIDEQGQHYLGRLLSAAARMHNLIEDLLRFSQLTRLPLQSANVDMNELVAECWLELQESCSEDIGKLEASPLDPCIADRGLLKQVVHNLLSNAVKYSRHSRPRHIAIYMEQSPTQSVYVVSDNGAGFDMTMANRLFGVFQRLHRNDEFEGTGVGLALCRRIIERHGGTISAESAPGKGALFRFTVGSPRMQ